MRRSITKTFQVKDPGIKKPHHRPSVENDEDEDYESHGETVGSEHDFEDESDEEQQTKKRRHKKFMLYKKCEPVIKFFKSFFPSKAPLIYGLIYFFVCFGLGIRRLISNESIPYSSYGFYLLVTGCIILGWITLRFIWMSFLFYKVVPHNRFLIVLNTVIDPYLFDLLGAVMVSLFWTYLPVHNFLSSVFELKTLLLGTEATDDYEVLQIVSFIIVVLALRVSKSIN